MLLIRLRPQLSGLEGLQEELAELYTDNGVSGQTFERVAFQRMLADIEQGKIDCVVVKDLSRLGRSAIDAGYYLEKYFSLHHVRIIAVNDQYNSENTENGANHITVALKNMINEETAPEVRQIFQWAVTGAPQAGSHRPGELDRGAQHP